MIQLLNSGWGQEGPYSSRAGYDIINASFGGLLSITGHPDGPPAKVGVAVTDLLTGALTASGILAAMQNEGAQWVKSSLFHTQSAMLSHIGKFLHSQVIHCFLTDFSHKNGNLLTFDECASQSSRCLVL